MVGIIDLWLPILLSAVLVFLVSSVVHMVLRHHWKDWSPLPGAPKVGEAMRTAGVAPGNYSMPHCSSMSQLAEPETVKQFEQGPVAFVTVVPNGPPAMGKKLALWFVYSVIVGVVVAYVTGRTLPAGTHYLQVFRVAGATAFLTYAGAEPIASIWMGRNWSTTIKTMFDGLLYALATAGAFGWLWPGV